MSALPDQAHEPIVASEAEALQARAGADQLAAALAARREVTLRVHGGGDGIVTIPTTAARAILRMLRAMADRKPVAMIAYEAELSTTQAADYLNVSRPHVCKLIDEGRLKARKVNRHRRIRFADLMEFEEEARRTRLDALAEMQKEARALGLE